MRLQVLIWQFVAFSMTYLYKILPQTNVLRTDLIPFRPEIQISLESHVYYACERLRWVAMTYLLYYLSEHYKREMLLFFALSIVFFADYVLYYNGTLFEIEGFPVSCSLLIAATMALTIIKCIIYDR